MSNVISSLVNSVIGFINLGFLLIFLILGGAVFYDWFIHKKIRGYINRIKWVTLQVHVPSANFKSAKSMEQVFVSLHGTYSFGIKPIEVYKEGKIEDWLSCEMVGDGNGVRFYVTAPAKYRNLIESSFFSQYPDVEIEQVEDYTKDLPEVIPNKNYDLFGQDYILARDSFYPIRTYREFEEIKEEKSTDSLSTLMEAMSNLKGEERIWVQALIKASGDDWKKKGESEIAKIAGQAKKEEKHGDFVGNVFQFIKNLIAAPVVYPTWKDAAEKKAEQAMKFLNPYEQNIAKAIGNKIGKIGFETIVRVLYIDKKEGFNKANLSALSGAFRVFNTQDLNAFRPGNGTLTSATKVGKTFKQGRLLERKKLLFEAYRRREPKLPISQKLKLQDSVLNVEELATIYHPPASFVQAPRLTQLEAKKGTPPMNLPIES
ncbi:MAG: hypothetical protein M1153_01670 [Patescibacteria group bacterium]|nr:hypothetical protein [Patescibacteria group bacterium]